MVYRPSVDQKLCFVLMPFGQPFDGYYQHVIKPAVKRAGLEALRADEIYGTKAIIQDIWESIWKTRLVIADVSGRNPNVNYELGLCHALGLPTILLTKRIEDVPFDYRHRRCLVYNTEEARWEERLGAAIEKTISAIISESITLSELRWPYETSSLAESGKVAGTLTIENPRSIILRGATEVERLVSKAYGPMGANVSVSLGSGRTASFKRGINLVGNIRSGNPLEQNGIDQTRQVAQLVQQRVGDGTKTAILIFHALLKFGHDALSQGHPLRDFIIGMETALDAALSSLVADAKPCSKADLVLIAQTAAGDPKLASLIVEAFEGAGKDGIITIYTGDVAKPKLDLLEGLRLDRGYISDKFVNSPETRECILEDCRLLIYDRKISSLVESLPLLEQIARDGKPLLIIADDVDGEALATLVINNLRGALKCAAVRAPGSGERRAALLEDIAVLTGGKTLSADVGVTIAAVRLSDLGAAHKVVVGKDSTTIFGGRGTQTSVDAHVRRLRSEISSSSNPFEREKLQERLTNLVGRIAVITVGGAAPPDVEEQRYRAESALHATSCAVEEGWVCGGGVSLVKARAAVSALHLESDGLRAGADVVLHSLERPFSALVESGGGSPTQILSETRPSTSSNMGFNAVSRKVEDLVVAGILDPVKMIRTGVEIAGAYAKSVLKTDIWSLGEPTEPPPPDREEP